mgnify:CR=1 FL=1
MGAWAYCNNADCSHEFDKPSFAEILARKRECPACGNVNYVSDDLGTALDAAFAEVAAGTTVPQEVRKTAVEANTAPKRIIGTLVCSAAGIVELQLPDGTTLPPGYYTVSLA